MKEIAKVKLHIQAGKATPAPPIGPSLAPHGINISEFCQQFNDVTKDRVGFKVPAVITIFEDRSFKFITKTPITSELIKKAVGIEKGSGEPNKKKVGVLTKDKLKEIAEQKLPDLNTTNIEQAMKVVEGTAKNMGVEVE